MRWTLPNILTILRLLAAPGVAVMFLYFQRPWADWFALVLFVLAAITDFLDGYLARAWKQESRFGAMLDPIADKAMVVIALVIIVGLSTADKLVMDPWILLPATVILFREVFVSGLREYLGAQAHELKVTNLAKYKTTVQMIAISVLFAKGVFEHWLLNMTQGMDASVIDAIYAGEIPDENRLVATWTAMNTTWTIGVILLWVAALLTVMTGWEYFQGVALPEGSRMIDVLYFAWVRERIGLPKERIATEAETVAGLVEELRAREERYAMAFSDLGSLRVALDQELADFDAPLAGVREVAFFPPMTGG